MWFSLGRSTPKVLTPLVAMVLIAIGGIGCGSEVPTPMPIDSSTPVVGISRTTGPSLPKDLPGSTTRIPVTMTIYAITNPNATVISVQHVITDSNGFYYTFSTTVPPRDAMEIHVRDIQAVPSPFNGTLTLSSDQPFTAKIVGYDHS